jgi:hypothetical protein
MPSTVIRTYEYFPARRELRVVFQSGRCYLYHEVPEEIHAAMKKAFSKGEFFNQHIRDHFEFTREDG